MAKIWKSIIHFILLLQWSVLLGYFGAVIAQGREKHIFLTISIVQIDTSCITFWHSFFHTSIRISLLKNNTQYINEGAALRQRCFRIYLVKMKWRIFVIGQKILHSTKLSLKFFGFNKKKLEPQVIWKLQQSVLDFFFFWYYSFSIVMLQAGLRLASLWFLKSANFWSYLPEVVCPVLC